MIPHALSIPQPARILAAPSWVMPGTMLENVRFMAPYPDKVQEIALCCFASTSVHFSELQEIAAEFFSLPFSFHVHLPVDLPWQDLDAACTLVTGITRQCTSAGQAVRAVLHPPTGPGAGRQVEAVAAAWREAGFSCRDLLLENIAGVDLAEFRPLLEAFGLSVCLDVGHMLAFGQEALLDMPELMRRVRLLHLHAPGPDPARPDRHRPLTELRPEQAGLAATALTRTPPEAVAELEVFNWQGYLDSLPVLDALLRPLPGTVRE
jgi:hypothetical protein